ncbi:DUF86 domain-containing protein [Methanocalculus taiwanensis]|uniref:DUF86 domain-containing protein n=1 Tax=Methanocalculus taiwanensis TaxID=106207 RepID=A0ABD4TK40_9EURY|nr:DUF86 domain-containing protein [Methanocalculus taiwanensis]
MPFYISHIIHEIDYIQKKCENQTIDDLYSDEDLQHIVSRALEIIGEASKNISPEMKSAHDNIPWKEIGGIRDKIIHGYFSINWIIVWDVITHEIGDLKTLHLEIK